MPNDAHLKGSEARLWSLIGQRSKPGTDKKAIDQRIWDLFGEDWSIMFTDLSGFSRQVEKFGIIHFLSIIHEQKELLLPIVSAHDGILIKIEADSFLIIFRRPERALECAIALQHACQRLNRNRAEEGKVLLCVGLGWGRILRIGDIDVYGAEVNAASKLGEDTAKSNEILVTANLADAVTDFPGVTFTMLGENIPGTDRAYLANYIPAE
ncbi:MAG: adenylate cyclase [Deltaproteobacteria bacterium RIFOXYB12_FULL_58_9]|nr:MAG: adenylate cyclase [Deltaproteobacteria bacterium RIFOXYB12_FULL_58_9]